MVGVGEDLKNLRINTFLKSSPNNLGDISDKQWERFHQDVKIMEG